MTELEAAQQIAAGLLPSPCVHSNITLFAVRVTGSGMAYRSSLDEFVWRDPAIFLSDEFVQRVSGLPLVWEHPAKGSLNSQEFEDRVIGALMFGYRKGDEIWGIARVYDDQAIKLMMEGQLSTSPGVIFAPTDGNVTTEIDGGKTLLVEGRPQTLCHLAVLAEGDAGVWDKGGPRDGVQNDLLPVQPETEGLVGMAEEDKTAADTARKDAEEKERRDAEGADLKKFMEMMSKRMDAMEEDRKADRRRDAQSKRDSEREAWHKADAEGCERDDAEEEKEREKHKADGMDEDAAADRARKDRRDRMDARRRDAETEAEKKAKEEAEEKERSDKARRDAEEHEKKEREDKIKADAQVAGYVAAAMSGLPKPATDADHAAFADAQGSYDPAYQAFGQRAPIPYMGENIVNYRRRMARGLQSHSAAWKDVNLSAVTDSAMLSIAETQIRADAIAASRTAHDVPDGVLVPVVRTLPTGHVETTFRGRQTFISGLKRPSMRATAFLTANRGA